MDVEEGSQSVYADLGFADAESMQRKAMLATRLEDAIRTNELDLVHAATLVGVNAACLGDWLCGRFRYISEETLHTCLAHLESDVVAR